MTFSILTKTYPIGYSDLLPEGICGLCDSDPQSFKPVKRKTKKKVSEPIPAKNKTNGIPHLDINYDTLNVSDRLKDLGLENTVEVSEDMLLKISKITEIRTKKLGHLLLTNTIPSILAHAAAINYVSAVVQDSFDIEFEEDPSIGEAIRDITKLEVIEFFIRRLKIPNHHKEAIMSTFIEKLTTKTIDRMEVLMKRESAEARVKSLEAVLASRSKNSDVHAVRGAIPDAPPEKVLQRPMLTPTRNSTRI